MYNLLIYKPVDQIPNMTFRCFTVEGYLLKIVPAIDENNNIHLELTDAIEREHYNGGRPTINATDESKRIHYMGLFLPDLVNYFAYEDDGDYIKFENLEFVTNNDVVILERPNIYDRFENPIHQYPSSKYYTKVRYKDKVLTVGFDEFCKVNNLENESWLTEEDIAYLKTTHIADVKYNFTGKVLRDFKPKKSLKSLFLKYKK